MLFYASLHSFFKRLCEIIKTIELLVYYKKQFPENFCTNIEYRFNFKKIKI